jgi:hypothetical protein
MSKTNNGKQSLGAQLLRRTTVHIDVAQCLRELGFAAGLLLLAVKAPDVAVRLFAPTAVVPESHSEKAGQSGSKPERGASLGRSVQPPDQIADRRRVPSPAARGDNAAGVQLLGNSGE